MPLSDTFLETVFINLPNDQIKKWVSFASFFRKIQSQSSCDKKLEKNITIIAGPICGADMQIRTVIHKTAYITYIT